MPSINPVSDLRGSSHVRDNFVVRVSCPQSCFDTNFLGVLKSRADTDWEGKCAHALFFETIIVTFNTTVHKSRSIDFFRGGGDSKKDLIVCQRLSCRLSCRFPVGFGPGERLPKRRNEFLIVLYKTKEFHKPYVREISTTECRRKLTIKSLICE